MHLNNDPGLCPLGTAFAGITAAPFCYCHSRLDWLATITLTNQQERELFKVVFRLIGVCNINLYGGSSK